jgi:ribonuclease HI
MTNLGKIFDQTTKCESSIVGASKLLTICVDTSGKAELNTRFSVNFDRKMIYIISTIKIIKLKMHLRSQVTGWSIFKLIKEAAINYCSCELPRSKNRNEHFANHAKVQISITNSIDIFSNRPLNHEHSLDKGKVNVIVTKRYLSAPEALGYQNLDPRILLNTHNNLLYKSQIDPIVECRRVFPGDYEEKWINIHWIMFAEKAEHYCSNTPADGAAYLFLNWYNPKNNAIYSALHSSSVTKCINSTTDGVTYEWHILAYESNQQTCSNIQPHFGYFDLEKLIIQMSFVIIHNQIIRCTQLNAMHCKDAASLLNHFLSLEDRFIAIIQEPYYNNFGAVGGYRGVQVFKGALCPRACIVTDIKTPSVLVNEFSDRDTTTIALKIKGATTYIISSYMPRNNSTTFAIPLLVSKAIKNCRQRGIGIILGSDTNCHTPFIGGVLRPDKAGELLENLIIDNNLLVINDKKIPTFSINQKTSFIDITATNNFLNTAITNWKVCEEFNFSDHNSITFDIESDASTDTVRKNYRKCNWKKFVKIMDRGTGRARQLHHCRTRDAYDKFACEIQKLMTKAKDDASPNFSNNNRNNKSWWNPTLDKLHDDTEAARKRLRITPSDIEKSSYSMAKHRYSYAIKKAKGNSWKTSCTEAKTNADTNRIIKMVNKIDNPIGFLKKNDDSYTQSQEETLQLLQSTHFPNCIMKENLDDEPVPEPDNWIEVNHKTRVVKTKYIRQIISAFGLDKAAGDDGITPRMLQHLPDITIQTLCQLYKCSLANGYIPKVWRHMKAIFIPKPGKLIYDTPKCYRPITLSNFTLKILEKLIQRCITGNILDLPLENQHGFTKGKSCESALSRVVNIIDEPLLKKKSALIIFLDISGAFDNVRFDSVRRVLNNRNISQVIINWYDFLLRNRLVTCSLNDIQQSIQPTQGTPQGGVLSAVIWNLVNQTLLDKFQNNDILPTGLADDSALGTNKGTELEMIERMQPALNIVHEWGLEEGLVFNASKTAAMMFTQKTGLKVNELPKLHLGDEELEYVHETKYLGVTFTSKLTWHKHIMNKISICKRFLMLLRHTVDREWGLSPDKVAWIWQTLVRPKLLYGAIAWADPTTLANTTIMAALDKLQRLALSMISSSMKSTPTRSMEMILGIPPLYLKIKEFAIMARIRSSEVVPTTWDGNTHLIRKGHLQWLDDYIKESLPEGFMIDRTFVINKFRTPLINLTGNFNIDFDDVLNIFTDASVAKEKAGAGWTIYIGTYLIHRDNTHLGKNISVFQGEIIAIYHATQWLLRSNLIGQVKSINFYSDSQQALSAIDFWSITSRTVETCTNALTSLAEYNMVSLTWIPAHCGIIGNEDADTEASIGRIAVPVSPITRWPLTLKTAKQMVITNLNTEWQLLVDNTSISHTKKFFSRLNTSKRYKKDILQLSRSQLNTVIAWTTGHCTLLHHLKRIGQSKTNKCRLCKRGIETPNHILRECITTKGIRQEVQFAYSGSRFKSKEMVWQQAFDPTFKCIKPNIELFNYILRTHIETNNELNNDSI